MARRGGRWAGGVAAGWVCGVALALAAGRADARVVVTAPPETGPALVVGVGAIGVEPGEDAAATLDLELRLRPRWAGLRPTFGAFVTADETTYVRAGASRDFRLGRSWVANLGFAAGAYGQGDGKDLGTTLEFRSALDLSYRLGERLRLGLAVAHLSNGGLSESNPGTETLTVTVTWLPRRSG